MNKLLHRLLAAALGLVLLPFTSAAQANALSMMVFNVGKADCILLTSGGSAYLIDTARSRHADQIQEGLAAFGVDHLDGVILTHMDTDHIGGLKKLLKSDIAIDHVYIPAFYCPEDGKGEEAPAVKVAEKQDYTVEYLRGGDVLPFEGGSLSVLGPIVPAEGKDDNNSIVLLAEAAGGRILLAGDMEFPEESTLLEAGVVPSAEVLKVGNHGDSDATSDAFLSAVQPKIAVISTSTEEKTSTPAPRTLRALAAWNAEVYQTQEAEWGILVTIQDGKITAERLDALP